MMKKKRERKALDLFSSQSRSPASVARQNAGSYRVKGGCRRMKKRLSLLDEGGRREGERKRGRGSSGARCRGLSVVSVIRPRCRGLSEGAAESGQSERPSRPAWRLCSTVSTHVPKTNHPPRPRPHPRPPSGLRGRDGNGVMGS